MVKRSDPSPNRRRLWALCALPFLLPAVPAAGQEVVQAVPDPAAERLTQAMAVLARQPDNVDALVSAAEAALRLDDLAAAEGFYARARAVAPGDGRVLAGTAAILVRQDRPVEALESFAAAEASGIAMTPFAADRGLAYDLVGDNASAQASYRTVLATGADDLAARRLGISQAIAGDRAGSEATLLPLLQQQDLAAFRVRAFALAILGQEEEAVSIAETMLPQRISSRLAPYLRYMPRLTRAQQAAAANLGRFPRAQDIGHDDPAIQALSQAAAAPAQARRQADERLAPSGPVLGSAAPAAQQVRQQPSQQTVRTSNGPLTVTFRPEEPAPAPAAPPATDHVPAPTPAAPGGELPPVGVVAVPAEQPQLPPAPAPTPEPAPNPAPEQQPAFLSQRIEQPLPPAPAAALPVEQPLPTAAPVTTQVSTQPPPPADLSTAFSDFSVAAPPPLVAPAGAVDITSFEPRRERPTPPAPPPPPPPPPVPSRIWVQVATGSDQAALGFDWRRIRRQADGLLDQTEPHLAAWDGRTRLLAGPFSAAEAQELVTALKAKGVDSFRFTSARGEEVRALD